MEPCCGVPGDSEGSSHWAEKSRQQLQNDTATIEENILKMQSKKQQQLDAMLESGGHELGKSLAWDEIAALLDGDLK